MNCERRNHGAIDGVLAVVRQNWCLWRVRVRAVRGRAFARGLLEYLPIETNSDDFVFDNQILAQVIALGYPIGEVTVWQGIFPRHRQSIFAGAFTTAWDVSPPGRASPSHVGDVLISSWGQRGQ
jgi:hypothetical protein